MSIKAKQVIEIFIDKNGYDLALLLKNVGKSSVCFFLNMGQNKIKQFKPCFHFIFIIGEDRHTDVFVISVTERPEW